MAPSKEEKLASHVFNTLVTKKSKKAKKGGQTQQSTNENTIDFQIIKKFNSLNLAVPIKEEDYAKTITELDQLRDALIYWGKIIQRQTRIKYIRNSLKLSKEDEFKQQAEDDEKYIEQEKAKYQGEDASKQELNADKLKIAQVIDRESRINRMWADEDDDEDGEQEIGSDDKYRRKPDNSQKQANGSKKPAKEKYAVFNIEQFEDDEVLEP